MKCCNPTDKWQAHSSVYRFNGMFYECSQNNLNEFFTIRLFQSVSKCNFTNLPPANYDRMRNKSDPVVSLHPL